MMRLGHFCLSFFISFYCSFLLLFVLSFFQSVSQSVCLSVSPINKSVVFFILDVSDRTFHSLPVSTQKNGLVLCFVSLSVCLSIPLPPSQMRLRADELYLFTTNSTTPALAADTYSDPPAAKSAGSVGPEIASSTLLPPPQPRLPARPPTGRSRPWSPPVEAGP
jgi:hypothetical protein